VRSGDEDYILCDRAGRTSAFPKSPANYGFNRRETRSIANVVTYERRPRSTWQSRLVCGLRAVSFACQLRLRNRGSTPTSLGLETGSSVEVGPSPSQLDGPVGRCRRLAWAKGTVAALEVEPDRGREVAAPFPSNFGDPAIR
jgi:hypothetical protein